MAVHEYKHGVLPSEYDIREIDEELYLELLQEFKSNFNKQYLHLNLQLLKKYFN